MKLNNEELYRFLIEKGVTRLYHANTVATSMTFIEQNGLLSRGAVESQGLHQTPQTSDEDDKTFNVWNDVFLDTVDLHCYFNRQNFYGPLSFQFSIELLLSDLFEVWVTKDNPINWDKKMTTEQKYFTSVEELKKDWDLYQRQRKMVTLKNVMNPVLFDYLIEILVDDPSVQFEDIIFFNQCMKGIKDATSKNLPLRNKFKKRQCGFCYCKSNYLNQVSVPELKRLFFPN